MSSAEESRRQKDIQKRIAQNLKDDLHGKFFGPIPPKVVNGDIDTVREFKAWAAEAAAALRKERPAVDMLQALISKHRSFQ